MNIDIDDVFEALGVVCGVAPIALWVLAAGLCGFAVTYMLGMGPR